MLETLYAAHRRQECLGVAEIGRRAGIFREAGWGVKSGNDHIAWGLISSLAKHGHVEKCVQANKKGGWKLSPAMAAGRDEAIRALREDSWGGDRRLAQLLRVVQWGLCIGCLVPFPDNVHVDHIVPRSLHGPDIWWNKRLLCAVCNMSRNNRPTDEWLRDRWGDDRWADYWP